MFEDVVEVLIYLYENYMDGETPPPNDPNELKDELTQAGFSGGEVDTLRAQGSIEPTRPYWNPTPFSGRAWPCGASS